MLVKPFVAKLSNIGAQVFLRCDPKYRHFWDNKKGVSLNQKKHSNVKIKDVLLPYAKKTLQKGPLDDERPILELNDVESRTSIILQERIVSEAGSTKLDFGDCDLVFNKLEPYLGKIVINDFKKKYIGTTEWIPLKLDNDKIQELYFKYILLLKDFLKSFWLLRSGKRHARISQIDFQNMLIPLVKVTKQQSIQASMTVLETKMLSFHHSISEPIDIIDDVLSQEFGYDRKKYLKKAETKQYTRKLSEFQKAIEIRSTVKFQHQRYEYLEDILPRYECLKLKKLYAEKIHRGVQPKYDRDGEIRVVKTLNLKHGYLDFTESEFVNKDFYQDNQKGWIEKNDILVSSTGEGRGKVDIYDLDDQAIADSHISIIRLKKGINPLYVLYFLRSLLGKLQMETIEMAIKGTPEIYPDQLEQLRVIDLAKDKQDEIVKKIHQELENLRKKKQKVIDLRNEIDKIVLQELR